MKELRDLVEAYEAEPDANFVLATVVATRGSTYRKPGARMLLSEHAWLAGAISGGCVEADLIRKAWWKTSRAGTALVTYDGELAQDEGDEDAAQQGFGLGCDGSVDVLLQRVRADQVVHPLRCLRDAVRAGEPAVVSTVVGLPSRDQRDLRLGQQLWLAHGRAPVSSIPAWLEPEVFAQASALLSSAVSARVGCTRHVHHPAPGGEVDIAHELIVAPPRLLVFGQNYDALPVASLADQLGWDVTLVAARTPHRSGRAQPAPSVRMVLGTVPDVLRTLPLDGHTSAVVMTHNYRHDRQLLGHLLHTDIAYLGMLGPARRTQRMLRELSELGTHPTERELARLHAPVGLDLGASSPEEIALSIVAELQACLRSKALRPQRGTAAPRRLHPAQTSQHRPASP